MRQWPMVTMSELFHLEKGKIGIKAATPGAFPLVTTGGAYLSHIEPHFSGDSICIPLISATGHGHASLKRLHHIEGDFAVGSILCACVNRAPDRVWARYAYYFLSACKDSVLIPLMQGTANMSMKVSDIARVSIPLPPLAQQQAIVRRLDTLTHKTREVNDHLDAIERDADRLLRAHIFCPPGETPVRKPMSELLTLRQPDIRVDRLQRYHFAGVYSFGRGVFASVSKDGGEFAYERLSTVYAGDFTYPKLMAWEGAMGIVPPECDGLVVSPEFPVFTVNTYEVLPEVLDIYFRTPDVWPQIADISGGTNVRRRRVQPSAFLRYEMPIPSMRTQLKIRELYRYIQALKTRHATIRKANDALIPATLERMFSGTN
ncbi:restriction endonuclease subunit S [Pseudomonas grimontii]|uniref:restriction endonuclease subunit S n=1 Tax=Pseudomonas grimontii TaxID=129847 RepID=UPI00387AD4A9